MPTALGISFYLHNNFNNQKMRTIVLILSLLILGTGCAELNQIANEYAQSTTPTPTNAEITNGLKSALTVGIKNAVATTQKGDNGFYSNALLRIPVPQEAQKVMTKLRDLGMGTLVDDFEESMNLAATEASEKATDIFVNAITQLTIQDAMGILTGPKDAATQYLKKTTSAQLATAFKPITTRALNQTHTTAYWNDIINTYNKIPFVEKVNPDLQDYVTNEAIKGLFKLVAQEEQKIRENPQARVTEILQKVFGYNDTL